VFFERAYVKPRELTWVSGFLLLMLAMGFGFSGYLLPWNKLSYFATKVGTDIPGILPGVGDFLLKLLRGSEDVTGATLSRFFGFHAAVLPAIFTVILGLHLMFVQVQGMSQPHFKTPPTRPPMPFFPNFVLRDVLLWLLVLNLLALLAVFFPWELGEKADRFAPAPAGIKPEWYFLGAFEMLRLLPSKVLGIAGELLGVFGIGFGLVMWALFPWWDRRPADRGRTPWVVTVGVIIVIGFVVLTYVGWRVS
jgi:cytochrome b6